MFVMFVETDWESFFLFLICFFIPGRYLSRIGVENNQEVETTILNGLKTYPIGYLSKMDIARYQDYAFGFCVSNKFEEAGTLVRHVTPALHSFFPRDSLDTRHDDAYLGWFLKLRLQPRPLRFAKECA